MRNRRKWNVRYRKKDCEFNLYALEVYKYIVYESGRGKRRENFCGQLLRVRFSLWRDIRLIRKCRSERARRTEEPGVERQCLLGAKVGMSQARESLIESEKASNKQTAGGETQRWNGRVPFPSLSPFLPLPTWCLVGFISSITLAPQWRQKIVTDPEIAETYYGFLRLCSQNFP